MTIRFFESFLFSVILSACGNVDEAAPPPRFVENIAGASTVQSSTPMDATGGSSSTASKTSAATGGDSATGGNTWTTTQPATGGQQPTGGTSGNADEVGGTAGASAPSSTAAVTTTGGWKSTGGSSATGGTTAQVQATGGKTSQATGGSKSTGGAAATGGAVTGGAATGGALGTGGSTTCLDAAKQACGGLIDNPTNYQACLATSGCPEVGTGGTSSTGGSSAVSATGGAAPSSTYLKNPPNRSGPTVTVLCDNLTDTVLAVTDCRCIDQGEIYPPPADVQGISTLIPATSTSPAGAVCGLSYKNDWLACTIQIRCATW